MEPFGRFFDTRREDPAPWLRLRGPVFGADLAASVAATIADVRGRGDVAALESARRFDAHALKSIEVSRDEIVSATVEAKTLDAIRHARDRVIAFHKEQLRRATIGWEHDLIGYRWRQVDREGAEVGQRMVPMDRVGVYVPGGRAAYPSSVIMNAVPALVAGVRSVCVCTPAQADGTLHPAVLVALREVGIDRVFKIGGAAAVAAMAFGTATIPAVDKIVGPGNAWVNEAKRQVWGFVGVDGYAGPSEVCVVADATANPRWAAVDLLTQIEHAPDNAAFLVVTEASVAKAIAASIEKELQSAPRADVMRAALREHSCLIQCRDLDEVCQTVNRIAPEHLTLAIDDPEAAMAEIRCAGCVLLGEWTPESAGDYVIGPSHTLPTSRAARFQAPVNVMDFLRLQSVSKLDASSLARLGPTIEAFGQVEGFPGHARGAAVRQN